MTPSSPPPELVAAADRIRKMLGDQGSWIGASEPWREACNQYDAARAKLAAPARETLEEVWTLTEAQWDAFRARMDRLERRVGAEESEVTDILHRVNRIENAARSAPVEQPGGKNTEKGEAAGAANAAATLSVSTPAAASPTSPASSASGPSRSDLIGIVNRATRGDSKTIYVEDAVEEITRLYAPHLAARDAEIAALKAKLEQAGKDYDADEARWEWIVRGLQAAILTLEIAPNGPACAECGKPATCFGSYEDRPHAYACDACCGHGCEDGRCRPVVRSARPAAMALTAVDVEKLAEALADDRGAYRGSESRRYVAEHYAYIIRQHLAPATIRMPERVRIIECVIAETMTQPWTCSFPERKRLAEKTADIALREFAKLNGLAGETEKEAERG